MSHSMKLNSLLAEMRETAQELNRKANRRAAEVAQAKVEGEDTERLMAQKRRNGEWGPEWRTLQGRIDLNQTTMDDIYTGMDHSPEARAVRVMVGQQLAQIRAQRQAEEETAAADPFGTDIGSMPADNYAIAMAYREELLREIQSEVDRRAQL